MLQTSPPKHIKQKQQQQQQQHKLLTVLAELS